jgi:hypothetical protein
MGDWGGGGGGVQGRGKVTSGPNTSMDTKAEVAES